MKKLVFTLFLVGCSQSQPEVQQVDRLTYLGYQKVRGYSIYFVCDTLTSKEYFLAVASSAAMTPTGRTCK